MRTYITKLTMHGFKSFNKKITIPFYPGYNVIAGPNGSGKSNIVDAISFVLGRISAKSLRAGRLSGLIFRGSDKKPPAQQASVTIYFDNSKRIFPFDDDEIQITRKINKKGVSVYKLNGKTTTREKILEVLSLAWIRPNGYNIIHQGDVTRIIEMNPVERRIVIDEISGIAEYNDKKAKAMRDLEIVDQKLREAEILIQQKYEIFKKLEAERNAAIKYQNLQTQLKVLKASYLKKRKENLEAELDSIENKIFSNEEKMKNVSDKLKEIEEKLETNEKNLTNIAKRLISISKEVKLEKEISEIRSRLMIVRDKIQVYESEIKRIEDLLEKLEALELRKSEMTGEAPRAVREILSLKLKGVYGTVADLISVPPKYKIAIEVAAGPHLYDIIVEDDEVAEYCINFLKREKIGRATFLPLNKIKPRTFTRTELLNREGVIGVASKLIKFDIKFLPAMEFVFGNTLVVEDIESARNVGIGRARMVTLDGDLIERSGVMIGGYYIKTHPKVFERSTEEEISRHRKTRMEILKELEELKEEKEILERKLDKISKKKETREMIDLEKLKLSSEKEIDRLRERKKKLQERKINLEIDINRLNIQKAKIETEIQQLVGELKEYEGIETIDEKLHILEKMIKDVEFQLKNIGPVNFKAIEEFEKFNKEFETYKEKYEKILEEKKAVIKMIEEIEEKRKEVFMKTLEKVSIEFNNVYNKMTGGTAKLTLEDPNNIESGLLIEVNPPGKRNMTIDSASGGEKSLIALAFLFAIQRYRPSSFYILDEVDAALDKYNTEIIAKWIKKMSKETQFIVISHNDLTIKYADRLYGVTIEDGESKIIALELPKQS